MESQNGSVPTWVLATALSFVGALLLLLWGVVRGTQKEIQKRMDEHFQQDDKAHDRLTTVETEVRILKEETNRLRKTAHDIQDEMPKKILETMRYVRGLLPMGNHDRGDK